jgi:hypothetical protein
LTLDRERQPELARKSVVPRASRKYQAIRSVRLDASAYSDSFTVWCRLEHGLVEACFRAGSARSLEMRSIARLGVQVACPRIEHCNQMRLKLKRGEPFVNLRRSQDFMRELVLARAPQRARDYHSVARADHESTGDLHQRCPTRLLQLAPQFMRSLDQRDVQRMLEVRLANDAAVTVRGAELVSLRELLESENAKTSAREME